VAGGMSVALFAVWLALVVDVVAESAVSGGATIIAFGRTLASPGNPEGTIVLAALVGTAVAALVGALAWVWGMRRERRMASELDTRWQLLSAQHAGAEARARMMEARVAGAQEHFEAILSRREALIEEMAEIRAAAGSRTQIPEPPSATQRSPSTSSGTGIVAIPDVVDAEPPDSFIDIPAIAAGYRAALQVAQRSSADSGDAMVPRPNEH